LLYGTAQPMDAPTRFPIPGVVSFSG